MKNFADLSEREVLAVAISAEEEDSRIYMSFAEDLGETLSGFRRSCSRRWPKKNAAIATGCSNCTSSASEAICRRSAARTYAASCAAVRSGRPRILLLDTIRKEVETMELQAEQFYIVKAAEQAKDIAGVRRLLGDLAEEEKGHETLAIKLTDNILNPDARAEEDKTRRTSALQDVQPGLAGRRTVWSRRWRRCSPPPLRPIRTGRFWSASRRLDRRRHQHGICRSAVRRRFVDRARLALAARHDLRPDDDARRSRSHPALSGPR